MHTNRISRHLDEPLTTEPATAEPATPLPSAFVVVTGCPSASNIYEAAYRKALFEHQIDRLFNPEYYGE